MQTQLLTQPHILAPLHESFVRLAQLPQKVLFKSEHSLTCYQTTALLEESHSLLLKNMMLQRTGTSM